MARLHLLAMAVSLAVLAWPASCKTGEGLHEGAGLHAARRQEGQPRALHHDQVHRRGERPRARPGAGARHRRRGALRSPFTLLRSDVFLPLVDAFTKALAKQGAQGGPVAKAVKPYAPFQLCYDRRTLANTRIGYLVPAVTLTLGGGKNWTMDGLSLMVDMGPTTACLAFVQMQGVKGGDGSAPSVLIGGFQMENTVLEFHMKKKRLGFARLPSFTQCSHFNFTTRSA
ncbi:hypothetical protein TRIUR3_20210 [Triticum urartu]|uniref:Xylanase inhibitor C-terminal domain-containing protein n=1 Tax=Triticum urartu TaxID=4572 RepID=M7YXI7_TRIUA|nr:hypothetical protein TRIUR3_20210 [Triticum urartu]